MATSLLEIADHLAHELATNATTAGFIAGVAGGSIMGLIFFAALYWTVRKGINAARPGLWFSTSFVLRFGLLGAGLAVAGANGTAPLLGCACGLVLSRVLVKRLGQLPT